MCSSINSSWVFSFTGAFSATSTGVSGDSTVVVVVVIGEASIGAVSPSEAFLIASEMWAGIVGFI